MPHRSKRQCTYPGCHALTLGSRCDVHTYGKTYERNPVSTQLYNSPEWQAIRAEQLRHFPWCGECMVEGKRVPATEVDHVNPHHGDADLFLRGPFQSLCKSHHSKKTRNENLGPRE